MTARLLSPEAFADICDWIRLRWPTTRTWRHPEDLYPDFERLRSEAIRQAAQAFYDEGHPRAPSASELRARARQIAKRLPPPGIDPTDPDWCPHPPPYAIEHVDGGLRQAWCRECRRLIKTGAPWQLPTVGERQHQPREEAHR